MSLSVTTDWTDVCIQGDGDRMAAIIHPVPAENDGFIGHLSTSSAFEEDIASQGPVGARVCVCVCYSFSITINYVSGQRFHILDKVEDRRHSMRKYCVIQKLELSQYVFSWLNFYPGLRYIVGLTLEEWPALCHLCVSVCVRESRGPLMTADDRPRRMAL